MSVFVIALKRSLIEKRITIEKIDSLLADGKITQEEYDFITGV